jgi:murein L,D-transpeptidase YcbB/YkuD
VIKFFKRSLCAAAAFTLTPAIATAAPQISALAAVSAASVDAEVLRAADVSDRGRYVVVDAASARLFMIENGEVQDSMRVIVGKPSSATPAVKSTLNFATVNPYWNVPTDLARTIIAPKVLKDGTSYLRERGYEVISHFGEDARVLPGGSVDWQAVASGRETVHVRQLPGPGQLDGTDQDRRRQYGRHLSSRHSEQGPVRRSRAEFEQRLRPP